MKLLLCLILCAVVCTDVTGDIESRFEYSRKADTWLLLRIRRASWYNAGMYCQLIGGILASPTTEVLAKDLPIMMSRGIVTVEQVHTGINSMLDRNNFRSLEGVPLADIPVHWASGEPDSSNSDDQCVVLTVAGALAKVSCGTELPFFCRKEVAHKCGPKNNGYEWEPRTGSCYKFHHVAKTWNLALKKCHAEGGHLAIINNETESTALKEIFAQHPDDTITRTDILRRNHAFVGFRKWDHGEWATIDGDTLSAAVFDQWASGEPNNNEEPENCGSISRDGLLNDAPCRKAYPYVCEITP